MRKNERNSSKASPSAGISMVLVVVMLMVFFILGAAVLTAASATTAAAARRTAERQAYYYARSCLDVLDDALQTGALGNALRENMRRTLLQSGTREITREFPEEQLGLTLTDADSLQGVTLNNAILSYTGKAAVQHETNQGNPDQVYVQLQNLLLTVSATYQEQTYLMRVQYRYGGWARLTNGTWEWSEGGWVIQQIG